MKILQKSVRCQLKIRSIAHTETLRLVHLANKNQIAISESVVQIFRVRGLHGPKTQLAPVADEHALAILAVLSASFPLMPDPALVTTRAGWFPLVLDHLETFGHILRIAE
jgi:hypothetical protein